MIRLDIDRMLALHGIRYGRSYLINHGYTSDEVRGLLGKKQKEVRYDMLARLCTTFNCLPNDLLTWEGDPNSHLNALKKAPVPQLEKLLEGKSPSEIEALLRKLGGGQ